LQPYSLFNSLKALKAYYTLHLTALHLTACLTALHLTALHLTALHLTALHLTALHLTALHLTAFLNICFFALKNPKKTGLTSLKNQIQGVKQPL